MLSALSSAHNVQLTMYNDPSRSFHHRTSPLLPTMHPHASPAIHEKAVHAPASRHPVAATKPRPFIISPGGMLRVYSYSPTQGIAGTPIVTTVQFTLVSTETTFLRVVIGDRALSTAVRPSRSGRDGEWELEAVVPELQSLFSSANFTSAAVPLTVQALNGTGDTLDSVTFGEFTYTRRKDIPDEPYMPHSPGTPDLRGSPVIHPLARKSSRPTPGGSGAARGRAIMTPKEVQAARGQLKKQSLIRARRSGSDDDDPDSNYRAILQLETPTDPMGIVQDWDDDERRLGRRLVRFSRVQEACTLRVVCEAIRPADYADGDTVVSCIFRPLDAVGPGDAPASQCCITSVDIIFLLECLVGDIFNIEEKNRIRRNLEGFRPKTVSKNKAGTEEFFQKIMDFPAPKPRNIEKDVKVFDWAVLPQALDKIISKYTLYPNVRKQDGSVTPPSLESARNTPLIPQASISGSYSSSSSPAIERSSTSNESYFYPQPSFHRSPYTSTSIDAIDSNNYVTATALSTVGYDGYLPHPHSHTSSPSSTPMLSPPADSPVGSMSYMDSPQPMYQSAAYDHGAYGAGTVYAPSFDSSQYQRIKMSPSAEMQQSQAYL